MCIQVNFTDQGRSDFFIELEGNCGIFLRSFGPKYLRPHRLAWSGHLLLRQRTPVQIRLGLPNLLCLKIKTN